MFDSSQSVLYFIYRARECMDNHYCCYLGIFIYFFFLERGRGISLTMYVCIYICIHSLMAIGGVKEMGIVREGRGGGRWMDG
jgi:hypothetical protein